MLGLQGFMQHSTFFNSNGPYVTKLNNFNVYAKHFAMYSLISGALELEARQPSTMGTKIW